MKVLSRKENNDICYKAGPNDSIAGDFLGLSNRSARGALSKVLEKPFEKVTTRLGREGKNRYFGIQITLIFGFVHGNKRWIPPHFWSGLSQ